MVKRIGIIIVVLAILLAMIVFASQNPGVIEVDLVFARVESSLPLAFTIVFVGGWLFGLLCISVYVLRLVNERRRLRKSLRIAEAEVSSLRNLPMQDAD